MGRNGGGRNFKPGESGNTKGRPPTPEDLKAARKLNRDELERLMNKMIWMTKAELLAHLKSDKTPGYEVLVGQVIMKGIAGGDEKRAEWLTSRMVGKVKDEIDMNVTIPERRIEMPDGTVEHYRMGKKVEEG